MRLISLTKGAAEGLVFADRRRRSLFFHHLRLCSPLSSFPVLVVVFFFSSSPLACLLRNHHFVWAFNRFEKEKYVCALIPLDWREGETSIQQRKKTMYQQRRRNSHTHSPLLSLSTYIYIYKYTKPIVYCYYQQHTNDEDLSMDDENDELWDFPRDSHILSWRRFLPWMHGDKMFTKQRERERASTSFHPLFLLDCETLFKC